MESWPSAKAFHLNRARDHRGPAPLGSSPGEQGSYFPQRDLRGGARPEQGGSSYGQRAFGGQMQGTSPTLEQNNPMPGGDQSFPQMDQRGNIQGREHRTYAASGTMGTDQMVSVGLVLEIGKYLYLLLLLWEFLSFWLLDM
ncbi:hypothetical protein CQW23_06887 [Capsicum baccatum]|uniref:Uncharacterized protein n=1 Tax=Capsicum baccatum TaxID=33114 RepID=A0A2G2X4K2_CAPBA|nr:hypothetical protein CQW23_06887 [Capsicum baccatum]